MTRFILREPTPPETNRLAQREKDNYLARCDPGQFESIEKTGNSAGGNYHDEPCQQGDAGLAETSPEAGDLTGGDCE